MLIESNTQKFLEFIFKCPTKGFTIRDIAKEIKVSPPTSAEIVKKLEKKELIEVKREKVQHKVFGNVEGDYFRKLKRIYNIFFLMDFTDYLVEKLNPDSIVVFGSYSKGEDIEGSDIDIFMDCTPEKEIDVLKFEKRLNRKIHIISKPIKDINEELRGNIMNGVILYGVLEC